MTKSHPRPPSDGWLLLAFLVSGASALGYEFLWTRLLALSLGSETLGILGVLAGFFLGLMIGAWAFDRRARRSRRPARWFAILEVVAAAYALVSPYALYGLARFLPAALGPVAGDNNTPAALAISIAVAGASLLPATICMGATLAALVEARRRALPADAPGRHLGRLYAANTLGATLGSLATVYWILPSFGMIGASMVLAGVGVGSAVLALIWDRRVARDATKTEATDVDTATKEPGEHRSDPPPTLGTVAPLWCVAFFCGLAGLGLEVIIVQILAQILADTVYTFANLLAVYLIGTAAGAWLYQWTLAGAGRRAPHRVTAALLLFISGAAWLTVPVLKQSPALLAGLVPETADYVRHVLGEFLLASAVFAVPTLAMGALFSHVVALLAERGVGRAYAVNTLGAALAPFVFGVLGIPALGYGAALMGVVAMYLAVYCVYAVWSPLRIRWCCVGVVPLLVAVALGPPEMNLVDIPSDHRLLERREGLMGAVLTTEHAPAPGQTWRRLQINKHFRMGGGYSFGERRMGHLSMLLAPKAKETVFLGIGSGTTVGVVKHYPEASVTAIEIVPEILPMLHWFQAVNEDVVNNDRVHFRSADARRFMRAASQEFDLVVCDLYHPGRDGAGTLYSREHFATLRDRLASGGMVIQWLPIYQLDVPNLRVILRTFLDVFPNVHSFLGIYNAHMPTLALVGRTVDAKEPLPVDIDRLQRAVSGAAGGVLQDVEDFLAAYFAGRGALAKWAGEGALNTDLFPIVLFNAPRSAYENRPDLPFDTFAELLPIREPFPSEWATGTEEADALRERARARARGVGHYLRGALTARNKKTIPPAAVDAFLTAYEVDPRFLAARGMLLQLAQVAAHADRILTKMYERNPRDRSVVQAYAAWLQKKGDRTRLEALLQSLNR